MSTSLIFRLVAFSVDLDAARARHVQERPELAEDYRWRSTGDTVYLLAGETGDNRTFDFNDRLAKNWQLMGLGKRSTLIEEACRTAVACEGGMLRFANSNWTSPENYISAVRKALKEAVPIESVRLDADERLDLLIVPAAIDGPASDEPGDWRYWAENARRAYERNGYLRHLVESGEIRSKVATRRPPSLLNTPAAPEVLPNYRAQLRPDGSGQASAVLAALADIPELVWDRIRLHQERNWAWDWVLDAAHRRRRAA